MGWLTLTNALLSRFQEVQECGPLENVKKEHTRGSYIHCYLIRRKSACIYMIYRSAVVDTQLEKFQSCNAIWYKFKHELQNSMAIHCDCIRIATLLE